MEDLFQKFINNNITKEELDILLELVKNPESKEDVYRFFRIHWNHFDPSKKVINENASYEAELLFYQIMNHIESNEKGLKKKGSFPLVKRIAQSTIFKIATVIILSLGIYYFFSNETSSKSRVISSVPVIDSNAITLTLSDGNIKVISEDGEEKIINEQGVVVGSQKGTKLSYTSSAGNTKKEKLAYNVLTVPYGKLANLELSDGTKITLNAGTSLKYPERFLKGLPRQVYLLNGEAYFEVAKDKTHPFVLNTGTNNIEVLGTSFNVSNYQEDSSINTVLIEGSVRLYEDHKRTNKEDAIMLEPGFKAAWDKTAQKMTVKKVDTQLYTAWKDGLLLFRKSSYNNIRKKLERYFNVVIENRYPLLDEQVYTATFDTTEDSIEDVLDAFKEDTPFNYKRVNNLIIITK